MLSHRGKGRGRGKCSSAQNVCSSYSLCRAHRRGLALGIRVQAQGLNITKDSAQGSNRLGGVVAHEGFCETATERLYGWSARTGKLSIVISQTLVITTYKAREGGSNYLLEPVLALSYATAKRALGSFQCPVFNAIRLDKGCIAPLSEQQVGKSRLFVVLKSGSWSNASHTLGTPTTRHFPSSSSQKYGKSSWYHY